MLAFISHDRPAVIVGMVDAHVFEIFQKAESLLPSVVAGNPREQLIKDNGMYVAESECFHEFQVRLFRITEPQGEEEGNAENVTDHMIEGDGKPGSERAEKVHNPDNPLIVFIPVHPEKQEAVLLEGGFHSFHRFL